MGGNDQPTEFMMKMSFPGRVIPREGWERRFSLKTRFSRLPTRASLKRGVSVGNASPFPSLPCIDIGSSLGTGLKRMAGTIACDKTSFGTSVNRKTAASRNTKQASVTPRHARRLRRVF
jgi:hypothetical protein